MNTSANAEESGSVDEATQAPVTPLSDSASSLAIPSPHTEPESAPDAHVHAAGDGHPTPVQRLLALLHLEASDLWVIMVYAIALGILSLATPDRGASDGQSGGVRSAPAASGCPDGRAADLSGTLGSFAHAADRYGGGVAAAAPGAGGPGAGASPPYGAGSAAAPARAGSGQQIS